MTFLRIGGFFRRWKNKPLRSVALVSLPANDSVPALFIISVSVMPFSSLWRRMRLVHRDVSNLRYISGKFLYTS